MDDEAASVLIEGTLVLVLFTDAARNDLRALRVSAASRGRLLGLGLPLTIALGAVTSYVVLDLPAAAAALLAATLAPTDAALGQPVVCDPRLPVRIRQSINVESGLNDGIVVPIVTVLLVLAGGNEGASIPGGPVGFLAAQIAFGVMVGLVVGGVGGRLLVRALEGDHVGPERSYVRDFIEDEGELLTATTFLVFGAVIADPLLTTITWPVVLYAVLSLTVVRMLPVALVLLGSGTRWESRLFLGWFGPRGLASILFTLLVAEELIGEPGTTAILSTAILTVLASVYAHGLTASTWSRRLGRVLHAGHHGQPELAEVPEMPTRRRFG